MEAMYMSIYREMDKKDVIYIYNGILFSHEKEQNDAICSNMDGPRDCLTEWSKSDSERQKSYDTPYQFSLVQLLCRVQLCDPMDRSTPGLPVHHQLPEFTQTHVRWVGDAIQPSHPLSSPSPPTLNLSQHQGLFQWVNSSHEVAKVLEFQLQHQSFQWTPGTDLL